uniref:NADH dehydrogenase subunit 4 n=1 Tax=Eucosmetus incisus TaxID=2676338 RepID=UPI002E7734BD|nr:NADH dehydrogenase subunit 4 [Eucosmetus incisus]WQH58282.1 NADH dehydrogenase subunit 4 [Eucosmetus incisus]
MMKYFLFVLFMILCFDWWFITLNILFLVFLFMFNNINYYFCSLSYSFGLDMVSFWMIVLSCWILSLMFIASYSIKNCNFNNFEFMFILLTLLLFLILCFSCCNLFIFYLFFESSIVPTFILIYVWGYQPERFMAGLYFLFYTLFASLPMLLCIFYIYNVNFTLFYDLISLNINIYIYISMFFAFLIKMPMFFFHYWLPKAHVEAPVSGSMILAGVLLKLGGFGLYRVLKFMYMYTFYNFVFISISLFGSVVVGILCLCQIDVKCLIAYSSVSHMGLVISGLMTCNNLGLWGSFVMMLGHGLCSSCMFSMFNVFYERSLSRSILINKGFMIFMPSMSLMYFLVMINNMSSPPSLNLLGEIMIIKSLMGWSYVTWVFLGLSSFLSCCYSIYMYSIIQHGQVYGGLNYLSNSNVREFILALFHLIPLNFLFLNCDLFTLWV